jgi:predicted NAD/FAD-binding protein
LERHGLLQVADHPEWRTIVGGARTYVEAIIAPLVAAGRIHLNSPVSGISRGSDGVTFSVAGDPTPHHADHVIVATHADQALAALAAPTAAEREVLGAIRSSRNVITVHRDASVMPRARHAWASWNYHHGVGAAGGVTMTYYLNTLQPLPTNAPIFESLNRSGDIDPELVLSEFVFHHPILDGPAAAAQQRHGEISGIDGISFCGAYWTHGFHEDGATSGVRVARALGTTW